MKREYLIDDIETLRVFADANRLAILQLLREPRSVKELAEALDVPRTRLYHHVNLMEAKGLIEVVGMRETGRIPEHVYQVTAHQYRPSDALLQSGDIADQVEVMLGAIFDVTRADLQRSILSGIVGLDRRERVGLSRQVVRIRPDRAEEFVRRLEAMVEDLEAEQADDDESITYAFTWAFYPSSYPTTGRIS